MHNNNSELRTINTISKFISDTKLGWVVSTEADCDKLLEDINKLPELPKRNSNLNVDKKHKEVIVSIVQV